MRGMGKHFRIIPGSGTPIKDGLNEPKRPALQLRSIDGGGGQPRYARPPLEREPPPPTNRMRKVAGTPARNTRFHNLDFGTDPSFARLALIGCAAMFWAVWQFNAPMSGIGPAPDALSTDTESASFGFCHSGGGSNCVVDGDTFYYRGSNIRIADIDTPETHPPGCASEARLGKAATARLQGLLNAGNFTLETVDRDTDRYGRKLRVVTRGGESVGGALVDEGLARWYESGRGSWC